MASITKDKNGKKRIQFTDLGGQRRTVRLGKMSMKDAQMIRVKIETILAAKTAGLPLDIETSQWLAKLEGQLAEKLAKVGLIEAKQAVSLKEFLDGYVSRRKSEVAEATVTVWGHTIRNLVEFFGEEKPLQELTEEDAEDWRAWLLEHEKLSINTVGRRSGFAKLFFKDAAKRKLVSANPFIELKRTSQTNEARQYFVTRKEISRILDYCPDAQWRAIVALARFGGLRTPSETFALRWEDINWDLNRMTIRSSKTERYEGHSSRIVPLFPELVKPLEDCFELAQPGDEYVIMRYRDPSCNLRTQFEKIIGRAGLKPWPKLFHNLRASRESELVEEYPLHVVCDWIGNSRVIAKTHYLMTRDEHFLRASRKPSTESGAKSGAPVAQNAAQHAAARNCTRTQITPQPLDDCDVMRIDSKLCDAMHLWRVELDGLEPTTLALQTRCSPN